MIWLRVFIHRLRGLFLKRKLERELEEEIRSHLEMRPIKMSFVFKHEGERLRGTFSGVGPNPPAQVTGSVKGNKVVFGWEMPGNRGTTHIVAFKGTIESATRMTGTVGSPFCADCEWTATKKK